LKNPILKFDLDLHFKVKLRPKSSKIPKSLKKIFFTRTTSARTEQMEIPKEYKNVFIFDL
jgi:hypothetical protein